MAKQFSLGDLLRAMAAERPDAPCLTFGDKTLTYGNLHQRSNRLSNALISANVEPGDRVAIISRNSTVFYELQFACAKAGAIMLPVNWRLSAEEITAILADAEPSVVLISAEFVGRLSTRTTGEDFKVIELDADYESRVEAAPATDPNVETDPGAPTLLLYTSGTTGRSKGVMISHHNLSFSARVAREIWGFTESSVNLVTGPLFHVGGIGYGLMALTQGGQTVLLRDSSPDALISAISTYRVTHTCLVPTVIQSLVDSASLESTDVSSLKLMVYGAAPISETLLLKAMKVFGCGFAHAYGMTETSGTVITMLPEEHDPGGKYAHRLRSCGRPLPWVEADLFNPETGQPVPVGEVGEIWVRSEASTKGYWRKPDETARTLLPDGWLRTGDAAVRDADGYFYVLDRYKDMIISGGENIYPAEIENVLHQHPAIAEVAVIGTPHERWGETPKAIVVLRQGVSPSETALIDFVRDRIARYKCPTSVVFAEALPRNAAGKILRHELRAKYTEAGKNR